MINSIKYFEEKCISLFEKLEADFMKDPTKISELVLGVTEVVHALGLQVIKDCLEDTDKLLRDSVVRKKHYYIEHHDDKSLITSLGTVLFTKTLFIPKKGGSGIYLLDRVMGLEKHERFTEDAVANLLEEAVQSSYRRGGEAASLGDNVTKQTVMDKIHSLEFPVDDSVPEQKKAVDYLYIEADEDHLSLQFRNKKGDLEADGNGRKNNCLISKAVYVHEGLAPENIINIGTPEEGPTKRWKLINPHYFCATAGSQRNEDFWDEIFRWINNHYDLFRIKKIYLNADGGGWITAATKRIGGLTYVLDEFHLRKYVTKLTSHMQDSRDDARQELYDAIRKNEKAKFFEITERLKDALKEGVRESGAKRIDGSRDYILSNWNAARVRLRHEEGVIGSSTEGHVYHVISKRMSTNPMGWSRLGAEKMTRLRAYYLNGGDMLELVRYQRKELPKAAGMEEVILSAEEIQRSERNRHGAIGKYVDAITHSIADEKRKLAPFKAMFGSRIR